MPEHVSRWQSHFDVEGKPMVSFKGLLPMILVHAFTHWFIGLSYTPYYVLGLVLDSRTKITPHTQNKTKTHSLLP